MCALYQYLALREKVDQKKSLKCGSDFLFVNVIDSTDQQLSYSFKINTFSG